MVEENKEGILMSKCNKWLLLGDVDKATRLV